MRQITLKHPVAPAIIALGNLGRFNINIADVTYLKGDGNYTNIHVVSGRPVMSARTLSLFEQTPGFIRIHKGYLVNIAHIKGLKILGPKEAFVVLKSGLELAVSRRRIAYVAEQIRLSRES